MDTDNSLSEIARSVLADKAAGDAKSFREKAGLLALLNLLGIVEAFYGEVPGEESRDGDGAMAVATRDPVVDALIKAPASGAAVTSATTTAPVTGLSPVVPISIVSGLSRLLGSMQPTVPGSIPAPSGSTPAAPAGGPSLSGLIGSLDPALIASVLGMVASMARARPGRAPVKVEAQVSDGTPSESGTTTAEPEPGPEAAPPSPLQQLLGIDPKVITLVLNVIAELMKSKVAAEPKDRSDTGQVAAPADNVGARLSTVKSPATDARAHQAASVRRPAFRLHKPGLGIYRSPRPVSRAPTQSQTS